MPAISMWRAPLLRSPIPAHVTCPRVIVNAITPLIELISSLRRNAASRRGIY